MKYFIFTRLFVSNWFFANRDALFLNLNKASVPSRVVPMGQIYPQNTLPIKGPDIKTMAAGIKETRIILALMAVINTNPGSIWRKKSREDIEIPEMEAIVNRVKNRTRQKI